MLTSTIGRVERDNDAIRTLTWLGSAFFSDLRRARFALNTWRQVGLPEHTDWARSGEHTLPVVEVWATRDCAGSLLGAMTIHVYSWDRMRAQRYFVQSCSQSIDPGNCLYIQPFANLVSDRTRAGSHYDVAIELGYMAVAKPLRGRGIGTQLFELFLERSRQIASGRALAFTIVMSRHAHSNYGQILMSHMVAAGAHEPTRAITLQEVAAPLGLPNDLLDVEPGSLPTARLAQRQGFMMAGYGKNLGQVWIRDMQEITQESQYRDVLVPQISLPPEQRAGSIPMALAMP